MAQRKRVKKRSAVPKKVRSLAASAGRSRYLPKELDGLYRPVKKPVTLRLDADLLAWFQRDGRGYQTRINEALRKAMNKERDKRGR
jgi:uncharacterized protein (DUF4415 family)